MTLRVEVPEELAAQLARSSPEKLSRQAHESLVLEAYREDRIGAPQAAAALGFSRLNWNRFLKEKQVMEHAYSIQDLERDVATLQRLRSSGVLPPA